jgi:outer membrane protein OmpA-like peptidoglycan-associated protein
LRASMAESGVSVVRQGNNITPAMPGHITFATNSADVNADFYPILDKVSAILVQYDQTMVEVAGHRPLAPLLAGCA